MKKICIAFMMCLLLIGASTQLKADDNISFFVNGGVITDDSLSFDPLLWYLGANLDFHLNDMIMISPEANVISYKFKFDAFMLEPAVLLNLKFDSFFVGGGINKYFAIVGDHFLGSEWGLKLNAGFRGKNMRLRFFANMAFDSLFKDMLLGVQLGIGF